MTFDILNVRRDFPMLSRKMNGKPLIYFDNAATTHKPEEVIKTIEDFYREENGTVHRAIYEFAAIATEKYSSVRSQVQKLINAKEEDEIIFTRGTTDSINLVASSFGEAFIKPGDEILITEMEHHSNIVPWQLLAEKKGAILKYIPLTDTGTLELDLIDDLLTEKTKILSLTHISNVTGIRNPIKFLTEKAKQVGAKVMVDGAQAIAHIPIDVQKLDVDFYAFSSHKMYGPTGAGILYGKKELLEKMPPYQGGGDMVDQVTLEKTTYQKPPLRFEAGTPPIAQVIGMGSALAYLERQSLSTIATWENSLLKHATHALQQLQEVTILGNSEDKGAIITFKVKGHHPLDLGTILGLKGIAVRTGHLCAQPTLKHFGLTTALRLSFGLYNTPEEIDLFIKALKEAIVLLNPNISD